MRTSKDIRKKETHLSEMEIKNLQTLVLLKLGKIGVGI